MTADELAGIKERDQLDYECCVGGDVVDTAELAKDRRSLLAHVSSLETTIRELTKERDEARAFFFDGQGRVS